MTLDAIAGRNSVSWRKKVRIIEKESYLPMKAHSLSFIDNGDEPCEKKQKAARKWPNNPDYHICPL